jgi:hypothetical protein
VAVQRSLPAVIVGVVVVATACGAAGRADAEEKQDATTAFDGPPQRRAGVVVGVGVGAGVAGASGYPNDGTKIDDPAYFASSGFMSATGGSLFVMGALADYVSFGFWFGMQSAQNGDWKSNAVAGGFRVEAFPLWSLYPKLADLGVFSHFGVGSAKLDAKRGEYPGADGVQSFIGAGAFYEWCIGKALGGHFAFGPSIEYDSVFSRSIERHGMLLGARLVWYGGK